ncbi:hypothetical protein HHI36_005125, partial [Cryptolaemus montrouzieri]
ILQNKIEECKNQLYMLLKRDIGNQELRSQYAMYKNKLDQLIKSTKSRRGRLSDVGVTQ